MNKGPLSYDARVTWTVFFASEAFIIVYSNIVALRIFLRVNKKCGKWVVLLVNLTIADLLVGFTTLLASLEMIYSSEGKYVHCFGSINVAAMNFSQFSNLASLSSISIIAIERAFAAFFPTKHHKAKRRYFVFVSIWSWFGPAFILLHGLIAGCDSKEKVKNQQSLIKSVVIPSILITVASYTAVLIKMRFFHTLPSTSLSRRTARLSRTLIINTVVTLITWIPKASLMAIRDYCRSCKENIPVHVVVAADCLLYGNSFLNLLIYCFRMPLFRKEVKKMFSCKCR